MGAGAEETGVPLKWFAAHVMLTALKRTSSPTNDATSARVVVSEVDSNAFTMALILDETSEGWSVRYLIQAAFCFLNEAVAAFFGMVCHKRVTCSQSQTITGAYFVVHNL